MRSLFLLHNETINIWSHILGFAFFAGLFVHDLVLVIPAVTDDGKTTITKTDFLVLLVLLICYQVLYFGQSSNEVGVKNKKPKAYKTNILIYFSLFISTGNYGAIFFVPHLRVSCLRKGCRHMFFLGHSWYYYGSDGNLPFRNLLCILVRAWLERLLPPDRWWDICACHINSIYSF